MAARVPEETPKQSINQSNTFQNLELTRITPGKKGKGMQRRKKSPFRPAASPPSALKVHVITRVGRMPLRSGFLPEQAENPFIHKFLRLLHSLVIHINKISSNYVGSHKNLNQLTTMTL